MFASRRPEREQRYCTSTDNNCSEMNMWVIAMSLLGARIDSDTQMTEYLDQVMMTRMSLLDSIKKQLILENLVKIAEYPMS